MIDAAQHERFVTEEDELIFLIEEVPRRLRRTFASSMAEFDMTTPQWRALSYIMRTPGLNQSMLARQLDLERASVGHIVDQLEAAGLAERRAAGGDRRVWTLHPLPRAIEILPSVRKVADRLYLDLLRNVPLEDIDRMRSTLSRMVTNITGLDPD
mgnify:FL=1